MAATVAVNLTGNPLEETLAVACSALLSSAQSHKQAAAFHRRRTREAHAQLAALRDHAARAGIALTIPTDSEGDESHG